MFVRDLILILEWLWLRTRVAARQACPEGYEVRCFERREIAEVWDDCAVVTIVTSSIEIRGAGALKVSCDTRDYGS